MRVNPLPTLIIVGGPPGTGKTTLAHELARTVGCPAICRDELKEGMAHATPGYAPGPTDELAMRTLSTFFEVVEVLLASGVTTVAEAAFQDRLWRPGLEPLRRMARIRIVHCTADAGVALERRRGRFAANPLRRAHEAAPPDAAAHSLSHASFQRLSMDAPWTEVDTTQGYAPGLAEIAAFAQGDG